MIDSSHRLFVQANSDTQQVQIRKLSKSESQTHLYRLQQLREKYSKENSLLKHSKTDSVLVQKPQMNLTVKLTPKRKGIQVLPPLPPDYDKAVFHTPPRNSSPKYERKKETTGKGAYLLIYTALSLGNAYTSTA